MASDLDDVVSDELDTLNGILEDLNKVEEYITSMQTRTRRVIRNLESASSDDD